MAGTKTLVIMAFWHTQRQIEREGRFGGWVFLWGPTRRIRRVNHLSIRRPLHSPGYAAVVDGRPGRMPEKTHFRPPQPDPADPVFGPKPRI